MYIYRPPGVSINEFIDSLNGIHEKLFEFRNTEILVSGDFNINLLQSKANVNNLSYVESYGFTPLILRPTRVGAQSANLKDNIWTNQLGNFSKAGIVMLEVSDHYAVFCSLRLGNKVKDDLRWVEVRRRQLTEYNKD